MTAPTRQRPEVAPNAQFGSKERDIINEARRGKTNNGGEVTLAAGATTTTINDPLISRNSRVFLTPMTANAAAAIATTFFDPPTPGQIVINHANSGQTDRTFSLGVWF